jgi:hypothetical protein
MRIKKDRQIHATNKKGSKWQELANFISRKYRTISIQELKKDPTLRKIHEQIEKIFSHLPIN